MNKLTTKIWGWLVVAAALTTGFTACSSDDNALAEPAQPEVTAPTGAVSTVHVTVGAGIGDGDEATTRADVWVSEPDAYGKLTRRLTFTAGDRLFVKEILDGTTSPYKYLAGYLSIDATSINNDGQSATFSGDLKIYKGDGTETTFDFGTTDPLEFSPYYCYAYLVPVDMADGFITIDNNVSVIYNYSKCIAADVNTLMKTALDVSGTYNATNKRFKLQGQQAILNCTISRLTAGRTYTVKVRMAPNEGNYNHNNNVTERTYAPQVTTDAAGVARFAIGVRSSNRYWVLQLIDGATTKELKLGQKELDPKVYNVTRNYTPTLSYTQAGSIDYIWGYYGLNESTWGSQSTYCLLKFKCNFVETQGGSAISQNFSKITISDGTNTYTISDIRPDGYGGTIGFDDNFQFYVAMMPADTPLTFTYDPHNNQYKYIGTTNTQTLAGGTVENLGTVELVKTNY